MIDLHFWPTPNGWKITIMLEECDLPYRIVPVDIGKGEQFEPEFLKLSPNNRMPAIIDHAPADGAGPLSIFESGAILQYLARKTGRFYPEDERSRSSVDQWLFWQVGGLGPMAGQCNHFRNYANDPGQYGIDRFTNEVDRLFGVMNGVLKQREWLANEYSIADIACWPWIRIYKRYGVDLNSFAHLRAWFDRMGERPAVRAGSNVGREMRVPGQIRPSPEAAAILFGQRSRTEQM
ncbi:MAG: glutathione S-transferase N-terminal domain-containing protein [Hyphomonadaceae bacterium]